MIPLSLCKCTCTHWKFILKYLIVVVSIPMFLAPAFSADLEGVWIQDIEKQYEFNARRTILTQREKDALNCGLQKMSFDAGVLMISQDKLTCRVDDKDVTIHPIEFKKYYRVLFGKRDKIVVEISDSTGKSDVDTLYFENEDLYWSYYYGENAKEELHLRTYYRRVRAGGVEKNN